MSRQHAEVMTSYMEHEMLNNVRLKAELADSYLGSYAEYASTLAEYINRLYVNSVDVPVKQYDSSSRFTMHIALNGPEIDSASVSEDVRIFEKSKGLLDMLSRNNNNSVRGFYICTENGLLLAYDSSMHPAYKKFLASSWYLKGKTTNTPYFTHFFISDDPAAREVLVTCAAAFYDDSGKFAGIICIDIAISELYNMIVNKALTQGSTTLIVDNSNHIITTQDNSDTIYSDPDIDTDIAERILSENSGVSLSKSGMYYVYATVKYTGWKICIKIPRNLLLASMSPMNINMILLALLFVAAIIAIMFITIRASRKISAKITNPIVELGRDVRRIVGSWELDHKAKIYDNDEIGNLAQDFNEMAFSLKEYMHDFAEVAALNQQRDSELNVATRIQADMLPKKFPAFPNRREFDIYATMTPAKEVGGDFYDFFLVDDDHLAIVIADVSDKGVPAALFMVIAKTLIKNRALMGGSPSEILFDVNNQLHEGNDEMLFVTVWLGILEISTGKVTATNAGHECPAIVRAGGKFELIEPEHDPAIAVMSDMEFSNHEFTLNPGDGLYLYTDGVAEANNPDGELFGTDRMLDVLNSHAGESAQDILHSIQGELDGFVRKAAQFDDITMLFLRYVSNEGEHDHLTIKAETTNLYEVTGFIERNLSRWECPDEIAAQIILAAEETFTNITFYAYDTGAGQVTIDIKREGHDAVIVFTDSGRPFNPLTTNLTNEEHQYKGLGIFIVKESMDELTYNYRNKKNVLQFRKSMLLTGGEE